MEMQKVVERMTRHLQCDPLDRTNDPYLHDRDQYHKDLFAIRDAYLSIVSRIDPIEKRLDEIERKFRSLPMEKVEGSRW